MEIKTILSLRIHDSSHVYEARRITSLAASDLGFSQTDTGRIAVIATEMVTNLIKHSNLTQSTFIALSKVVNGSNVIEMLSIDKGPGIKNVSEALRDGYSTAGSSGSGLGSIQRMSDVFDIYSQAASGTVILSQVFADKQAVYGTGSIFHFGSICLPVKGETENGDRWGYVEKNDRLIVISADGLGHGPDAAKASGEAVSAFENNASLPPEEIMPILHNQLKHTRGAAVAIAEIITHKNVVRFCSIGNISGSIINGPAVKNMISYNGIVGHETRRIHVAEYPW
ncbi:MAG: ATP-binding protein, partial [Syntrophothermus sp.]